MRATTLNLNAVIEQDQGILRRLIGGHIELATRLDPDLWMIRSDATQLSQVLMNLVVNARDAMPTGGKLTISSSNIQVAADEKGPYSPRVPHGDYVLLAVTDTGTGMTEGVRSRIFEPFFTTKPPGIRNGFRPLDGVRDHAPERRPHSRRIQTEPRIYVPAFLPENRSGGFNTGSFARSLLRRIRRRLYLLSLPAIAAGTA